MGDIGGLSSLDYYYMNLEKINAAAKKAAEEAEAAAKAAAVAEEQRLKVDAAKEAASDRNDVESNLSKAPAILKLLGYPPVVPTFLPGQPVDYRYYNREVLAWKAKIYSELQKLPNYKPSVVYQKGNLIKRGDQVYYLVLGAEYSNEPDYPGVPGSDNWDEVANVCDYAPPPPPPPPASVESPYVEVPEPSHPVVAVINGHLEDMFSTIQPAIGDPSLDMSPVSFGDDLHQNAEYVKQWKFPMFEFGPSTDDKVLGLRLLAAFIIAGLYMRSR